MGPAADRVEAAIAATEWLNPTLKAYLHVDREGARAEAAEVDAIEKAREAIALEHGGDAVIPTREMIAPDGNRGASAPVDPKRPLAGMPICVKDIVDVAGMPTTAGGADWVRHPDEDATVVARLRAAGAIVIGKGNTNEFACGIDGRNPHKGDCRNPYDPTRLTGGSSSGPAATVAAGMAEGSIGTDTSGSIRVPAALCGVVGIRPTRGLVPADGVVPLAWTLDAIGPLARDVATAALLLDVFAGRAPEPAPRPEVSGLRLGLATELLDLAEEPVAEAIGVAVAELRAAGAEVVDISLPDLERATAIHRLVQATEVAAAHAAWFDRQRYLYAPEVRARIEPGYSLGAEAYLRAQRHRRLFARDFAATMAGIDAVLAPASAILAPPVEAEEVTIRGERRPTRAALLSCAVPFSQLDCPAVSVPVGLREGLPVGLQLLGRPGAEPLLLRIAAAVEASVGPLPAPSFQHLKPGIGRA
ncbi:MAG TPA: amidase [Solirubrobacterales bacterium]|nr:amidase [Solirubrobacterales bacterium]